MRRRVAVVRGIARFGSALALNYNLINLDHQSNLRDGPSSPYLALPNLI